MAIKAPDPATATTLPGAASRTVAAGTVTTDIGAATTQPGAPTPTGTTASVFEPGTVLADRYEIRGHLGAGGMGSVYRAFDREIAEEVALKVLLPERAVDPSMAERFRREARLSRKITHPNVCRIFDLGRAQGVLFLTMEIIEGKTLRALLSERKDLLPPAEALALLEQIAWGLSAVHEKGVIHRDLKPENVIVRPDGRAILADFGLAHGPLAAAVVETPAPFGSSPSAPNSTAVAGTPGYMSPEQIRGEPLDVRSDVFSFGIVACELLGGRLRSSTERESTSRGSIHPDLLKPLEIPSFPPGAVRALRSIVTRTLAPRPEDRFASAAELAHALSPLCEGLAARRDRGHRPRSRALFRIAAPLILIAVTVLALKLGAPLVSPGPRTAITAIEPPFMPTPVTDLPPPRSADPALTEAYRAALTAHRNAAPARTIKKYLRRALPTEGPLADHPLAAAYVQLAILDVLTGARGAARDIDDAERVRQDLTERDQAILDALLPTRETPANFRAMNERLDAARRRFPLDAQLVYIRAVGALIAETPSAAQELAQEALLIDPFYARARALQAAAYTYLDLPREADRAFEECRRFTATADICRAALGSSVKVRRYCYANKSSDEARPTRPTLEELKLDGVAARRALLAAREATEEAAESSTSIADPDAEPDSGAGASTSVTKSAARVLEDAAIAILVGDFVSAKQTLADLGGLDPVERERAFPELARMSLGIASETEGASASGAVASSLLKELSDREARSRLGEAALMRDPTPVLLVAMHRSSDLTDAQFLERRDAWLSSWERSVEPARRSRVWLYGPASMADDELSARYAIDVFSSFDPISPNPASTVADAAAGHAYLLAGRPEEALPWLTRATEPCRALEAPIEHTRAHLWLGEALEARSQKAAACDAYRVVLDRWGDAKPRGATADEARARSTALHCAL